MLTARLSILALLFVSFSNSFFAQNIAPSIIWQQLYGSKGNDVASSTTLTKDGGYIFIGVADSSDGDVLGSVNHGFDDIWVVKVSAKNTIDWQKKIGGNGYEYCWQTVFINILTKAKQRTESLGAVF